MPLVDPWEMRVWIEHLKSLALPAQARFRVICAKQTLSATADTTCGVGLLTSFLTSLTAAMIAAAIVTVLAQRSGCWFSHGMARFISPMLARIGEGKANVE